MVSQSGMNLAMSEPISQNDLISGSMTDAFLISLNVTENIATGCERVQIG